MINPRSQSYFQAPNQHSSLASPPETPPSNNNSQAPNHLSYTTTRRLFYSSMSPPQTLTATIRAPTTMWTFPEAQLRSLGKALQEESKAHNATRHALHVELELRLKAEWVLWNESNRLAEYSRAYESIQVALHKLQARDDQLKEENIALEHKIQDMKSRNSRLESQV